MIRVIEAMNALDFEDKLNSTEEQLRKAGLIPFANVGRDGGTYWAVFFCKKGGFS